MIPTKKETNRSLSIHQKIRKAAFVLVEEPINETFKYQVVSNITKVITISKNFLVKNYQRCCLFIAKLASKYDWKEALKDSSMWTINSFIEGFTANIATYFLFGMPFNLGTILAHGILINQGLAIYERIRKHGPSPTIPKKYN